MKVSKSIFENFIWQNSGNYVKINYMAKEKEINFNNNIDETKEPADTQEKVPPRKIDIKKYQDPEGLTTTKMAIGLWLVKNRKNLLFLLYGVLALIGLAFWVYFLYIFGFYVSVGMKEDQALAREIIQDTLVGHDFVLSRAPQELQLKSVQVIRGNDNKYDFVVQVKNVNPRHWAEIYYYFRIGDENLDITKGYIMPSESKYFLALGEEFDKNISSANFVIEDINWHRLNAHTIPDWAQHKIDHLNIEISDIKFTPAKSSSLSEKLSLNDLKFNTTNNTPYNYWEIYFVVLLRDRDKIVGVNRYILAEFLSDQEREINVTWPGRLGRVGDIEIIPEVNIFEREVYIDFDVGSGEVK